MKRKMSKGKYLFLVFVFFVMPGITGCRYLSINHEDDIIEMPSLYKGKERPLAYNCAVIKGKIVSSDELKNPTLLIAYSLSAAEKPLTDSMVLKSTSFFSLYF